MVGEDLALPGADGRGQPAQRGHLGSTAVGIELGQPSSSGTHAGRRVHVSEELLGHQGGRHLVFGVAGGHSGVDVGPAPFREPLGPDQQQPPDVINEVIGVRW